jgi:hypothetical protein
MIPKSVCLKCVLQVMSLDKDYGYAVTIFGRENMKLMDKFCSLHVVHLLRQKSPSRDGSKLT